MTRIRRVAVEAPRTAGAERVALRAAAVALAVRDGAPQVGVAAVCARAGVREERFALCFESVEDCLLEAYEIGADELARAVREAFEEAADWRGGVRAAAWTTAELIDADPDLWRFGVLEAPGAGLRLKRAREAREAELLELFTGGGDERNVKAEGVLGGILAVSEAALDGGARRSAVSYVPELLFLAVAPFCGVVAAHEELRAGRPGPAAAA